MRKGYRRHRFVYALLRLPLYLFMKLRLRFKADKAPRIDGPYLVLANHNNNLDPVFMSASFKRYMYFVTSEHVLRCGWPSKLLFYFFNPITKNKGATDMRCASEILETLKQGHPVCLFAEGNRSFNGVTCPIHPATASLVKHAGVPLVTYRFSGGYLTSPRWSLYMRRGGMSGNVVGVYGVSELKSMDKSEINALIERDLYEDAYAEQERELMAYKGKRLAERLECALCICPACRGIGTLKSEGDRFFCSCGFEVKYNEYGRFSGENAPFADVLEWDGWQDEVIAELCRESGSEALFSDDDQSLVRIDLNHLEHPVALGRLSLFRDRLKLGGFEAPLKTIGEMAVFGKDNITFSAGGLYYLIKSPYLRCGRRYVTAFKNLKALR